MLGKLIKNEFKSSSHFLSGIYFAVAIAAAMVLVSYLGKIKFLSLISTVTLFLLAIGIIIVTLIFVVSEFYKTLYGAQGYLSFSLPVKSRELIASKAIVSLVWIALSYVMGIGLIIGVYIYLSSLIGEDTKAVVQGLLNSFGMLPSKKMIIQLISIVLAMIFIQISAMVSEIYFAITLANTRIFQKHGIISSLVIFFCLYLIAQGGMALITLYVPLSLQISVDGLVFANSQMDTDSALNFGIVGPIFQLVVCFVLYWATSYIMRKKVNVK